ncbi:ABC transporter ATP-binding protein, partial [Yaniella sp.]|uniref:ABC transporter ATP-binding protein n=1 Tax=Yaniella sp. TaxID=2773929 RepID=UPI002648E238
PNRRTPEPIAQAKPVPTPETTAKATDQHAATSQWRSQSGRRLLKPLKTTFIIAGVVQALVTLMQLAPFFLLVELSRMLLTGAESQSLIAVGIWAVALIGAGALFSSALLLWLHWVDAKFERELRGRMLRKLSRLPLGWFDARTSGQVKQLVQDDTLALHYLVTHAVPDAVAAVVAPLAVLGYLFVVDWRMALLLFVPVLVYIVTMYVMLMQSGLKTAQSLRWAERMNSEAGSYLEGQPVVRVFGGATASTFHNRLSQYIAFLNDWQRPFNGQKSLMDLATRPATFLLLITSFGTLFITTGSMEPVALLPFLFLGTTFGGRLLGIGYGVSGLRTGLLAAKRVQLVLDARELEVENSTQDRQETPAAITSSTVIFDRVNFSYVPGVPTLEDISFTLEPGTVTALVGPSGSGKSTLAALLARFHDVDTGAIRIGGQDIRAFTPDELYARVGFVFQQTQLVQGTVRDNIALARPEATDEQIQEATRAAQLHDRILRMPHGYDTPLGPDAALSGGERQRLTIARAILADTPILVLDEATAFADPESEYLVQQALNKLMQNRTVLVIAHRLHTITGVDSIVVVDHGRIAETGTHTQLLARGGRYRELWDADGSHTSSHSPADPLKHSASIEETR